MTLQRTELTANYGKLLDVLNVLNDTAEESITSAVYNASNVGQPDIFVDPRRAMLSVRLNLGR